MTYNNLEEAISDVQRNGLPDRFRIALRGDNSDVHWRCVITGWTSHINISLDSIDDPVIMESVMEFLGLKPLEIAPQEEPSTPARTAFIAHRFDEPGEALADRLARFLGLLGFQVLTGRGYSPESVREKVLSRIKSQALTFVIFTGGGDETWLTQESVVGEVQGKTVFLLKEQDADFKSGLFSDHEYISFTAPMVETAFIPILEGLHGLSYEF